MLRVAWTAIALLPFAVGADAPRIALEPCTLPGVEGEARCGHYDVFQDRKSGFGRKIRLFVAVLPAKSLPAKPDPLFVIAGGPGQGASSIAGFASRAFALVREHREIVPVDLAGTGRSGALGCEFYPIAADLVGDMYPPARVRACRESLERTTDLRRYTTAVLMDDLDEVRAALGYERINIYGTSYGTLAAFEYLRRHSERVRSVVMKAVVPPTMRGLMPDPAGGPAQEHALSRGVVASALLGLLQNSHSAVRLPQMIDSAHRGDTAPLVELIVDYRRGLEKGIGFGMHLSVMCSEAEPLMDAAAAARHDRDTALGDYRVTQLVAACREWVRGPVSESHGTIVESDVPALLISGTLDPNTNERWGAEGVRGLSQGTHVVIPNLSHGFSSIAECGAAFMAEFIEKASMEGVDTSCKDRVALPPFPVPVVPPST